MKQNRRAAYLIAALILCVPVLVFAVMGIYLTDENISGFTGMMGIMNMREGVAYVELTENPPQLMIRKDSAKGEFQRSYFETWTGEGDQRGTGVIGGRKFTYTTRAFTREFYIVLLQEYE